MGFDLNFFISFFFWVGEKFFSVNQALEIESLACCSVLRRYDPKPKKNKNKMKLKSWNLLLMWRDASKVKSLCPS